MGMLDGGIRSVFGAAFGALYLPGTLVRRAFVPDGEGGGTETVTSQPCRVQQDTVSEKTRAAAGYAQNEMRFLILQAGVTGPIEVADELIFEGETFMLSNPEQDPARSYWSVRGVPK